jgi:hypothetical protein
MWEIDMRLSKIERDGEWFKITLSQDGIEPEVVFTGNLEYALDLANEWENA